MAGRFSYEEEEESEVSLSAPIKDEPIPVRNSPYDYDLFVIGGGSGGLSAAKEAARLGAKVALADFVQPSPQGTTWGLGGTCVNVGCIPKKMMHYAGQFGEYYEDEIETGWGLPPQKTHNWERMVNNVQEHIQGLNWGYKLSLIDNKVTYYNNYASFVDAQTLSVTVISAEKRSRSRSKAGHFREIPDCSRSPPVLRFLAGRRAVLYNQRRPVFHERSKKPNARRRCVLHQSGVCRVPALLRETRLGHGQVDFPERV